MRTFPDSTQRIVPRRSRPSIWSVFSTSIPIRSWRSPDWWPPGRSWAGESEWILETAQERGLVEQRPGSQFQLGIRSTESHTRRVSARRGLAIRTRFETLESADVPVDSVTDLDGDDQRAIGSLVALDAVGTDEATATAAESVERVLRPYATPDGPFETVGGYADVLEASARTEPGTGAAFAMGHGAREPTLDAWREHGRNAHDALSAASTGRYDGLFVVGVDDGPVETVARIAAAYRSPEPAALAVGNGEVGLVTRARDSIAATVERIARDLADATLDSSEAGDGSEPTVEYDVGRRRGYLRYDGSLDDSTVIETVRVFYEPASDDPDETRRARTPRPDTASGQHRRDGDERRSNGRRCCGRHPDRARDDRRIALDGRRLRGQPRGGDGCRPARTRRRTTDRRTIDSRTERPTDGHGSVSDNKYEHDTQ